MDAWLEHLWVALKNNNGLYGLNKVISISLATVCAAITISLRAHVQKGATPCSTEDYRFLFWMLFVYDSFHALGELHELYLVGKKATKGVIGMLFDMNYFAGLYITYRVLRAVYESSQCEQSAPLMFKWLYIQAIVFYSVLGATAVMGFCHWRINTRVKRRRTLD